MDKKIKTKLFIINSAYIFFGATLYVGVLWALHFFWFPTWKNLMVENYYDQFIPQTTAATKFFTILVPIMFLSHLILCWQEWKTKLRWLAILALLALSGATYVGTMHIIPVNKILKQHITDQGRVTQLLEKWMMLNDIRMVLMTLAWATLMAYFGYKAYVYDTRKLV